MFRNNRRFGLSVICILVFLSLAQIGIAQGTAQGLVTADVMRVRNAPTENSEIVNRLISGTLVVIEGRDASGNWLRIRLDEPFVQGWSWGQLLRITSGHRISDLPIVDGGSAPPPPQAPVQPETQTNEVAPPPSTGTPTAVIRSNMNVRSGPGVNNSIIAAFLSNTNVILEARNQASDWVIARNNDGTVRGWVYAPYIRITGDINQLPVSNDNLSPAPPAPEIVAPELGEPTVTQSPSIERLLNTPILHNMLTGTVYDTFRRGQGLGNRRNVFMKVGDSITVTQPSLFGFGTGEYNLGGYGHLQASIDFFGVPTRDGQPNAWSAQSVAAQSGFVSGAVLDGLWTPPNLCGNQTPLECEYNLSKPAVAVVLLGSLDSSFVDSAGFRQNMRKITSELVSRGVIPILTTFPSHPAQRWDDSIVYNNIIVDTAEEFGVPLINLWAATQPMPDHGIRTDDYFHLSHPPTYTINFTGEETQYGLSARNLLTLQALDILRTNVLGG